MALTMSGDRPSTSPKPLAFKAGSTIRSLMRLLRGKAYSPTRSKLFRPGDGQPPKHLAGRERERQVLGDMLKSLQCRESPAHNAALHGPRGLGKTTLLRHIQEKALKAGVRVVRVSAGNVSTLAKLYSVTLGRKNTRFRKRGRGR